MAYIRQVTGVEVADMDAIKQKQLKWYEHVRRMDDVKLPKVIMEWAWQWQRRRLDYYYYHE